MKRFEIICGVVFLIALIFKIAFWPGGSILATLSMTLLACFYFIFGFAFFNNIRLTNIFNNKSYQDISELRFIVPIGVGCGLSTLCIGILFKMMHFPGGSMVLHTGLLIILIAAIIALVNFFRSKSEFYKTIFLRIIIIGGLGLFLAFPSSDIAITKILYRNHPDFIKAYENYLKDTGNGEAHKQWRMEFDRMNTIQEKSENQLK